MPSVKRGPSTFPLLLFLLFAPALLPGVLLGAEPAAHAPFAQNAGDDSAPTTATEDAAALDVTFLIDPWPGRPRIIAYEYNQKNHHEEPSFIARGTPSLRPLAAGMNRFRLIGIRFSNPTEVECEIRFHSRLIQNNKTHSATIPPRETFTRYFVVKTPKDSTMRVEVSNARGEKLFTREIVIPAEGRGARQREELQPIAEELEREDRERLLLRARAVRITVRDDLDLPVAQTRLVLLLEGGLMVYEGVTDADGAWSGMVMPGAYQVLAFAEVPDRTDYSKPTAVRQLLRVLLVEGRLEDTGVALDLRPARAVEVRFADADKQPLVPSEVWVTPNALREAYRYELVANQIGKRGRIETRREHPGGAMLILTSTRVGCEVSAIATVADGTTTLLRGTCDENAEHVALIFDPKRMAHVTIDATAGAGGATKASVSLVALDGVRERLQFESTTARGGVFVPPGAYRTTIRWQAYGGRAFAFVPYRAVFAPGEERDLTIRAPFDLPLYWKRDGKKVQFWLAVIDAAGRILITPPQGGLLTGTFEGQTYVDQPLDALNFEYAEGFESIDMAKIEFRAQIPFGKDQIGGLAHLERTTVYNADGSSGDAPACIGDRVMELLPEVKKAIDGCWNVLGLPDGLRRLHMEFVVFMPPGVGGTGGGGRITMEMGALFPFTAGTDNLPGPFTHELGHNLGFGHDPYMLLAPSGVDEPRFGTFGYRMLHAADFQRTLRYLEGDRGGESDPWAPGIGVFDGLRLLYGPDVHHKMLTLRRAEEQTLVLHGLSSIERIATLYSLALEKNVAWVFRAHGWPVFDGRVDLGAQAALFLKQHPLQLNYARLYGTAIGSWWILGPTKTPLPAAPAAGTSGNAGGEVTGGAPPANGGGGASPEKGGGKPTEPSNGAGAVATNEDAPNWRRVVWPSNFIRLDEDRAPATHTQSYLLFRRIKLPQEVEARLVCASDVQMEIRLNGTAIGYLDASPQYSQPVHDELMLNQKRGYHVKLYAGENFLEIAANQPPGSRGFLLEFVTTEGKPLPLAFVDEGPEGEEQESKVARLKTRNPVFNNSFEVGETFPSAWVQGPVEPWGGFEVTLDDSEKAAGERSLCLRMKTAARGGVIQRLAVEPGKKYRMSAWLRTQNLDGEAFVSFFTGDVHAQFGKTPPLREPNTPWTRYEMNWFPGESRVVYIACYLHGKSGTVWFDQIELAEIP